MSITETYRLGLILARFLRGETYYNIDTRFSDFQLVLDGRIEISADEAELLTRIDGRD